MTVSAALRDGAAALVQAGLDETPRLDVELLSEPAGVQAETALVSGQVQGAVGFYDHTLDRRALMQTKVD